MDAHVLVVCRFVKLILQNLQWVQEALVSGMSERIRLAGYDILADIGVRPNVHVYKVRAKLHDDVPQYMDEEEPCYALKYIELTEHSLPPEGKQTAVREAQALLSIQHTNIAGYHKAFLHEGKLCYMTEYAESGLPCPSATHHHTALFPLRPALLCNQGRCIT